MLEHERRQDNVGIEHDPQRFFSRAQVTALAISASVIFRAASFARTCFARSVLSGSRMMRSSSLRTSKYSTFGKSWTMRLGRVIWFLMVFLASMALPCNKEVRKYYSRGDRPARTTALPVRSRLTAGTRAGAAAIPATANPLPGPKRRANQRRGAMAVITNRPFLSRPSSNATLSPGLMPVNRPAFATSKNMVMPLQPRLLMGPCSILIRAFPASTSLTTPSPLWTCCAAANTSGPCAACSPAWAPRDRPAVSTVPSTAKTAYFVAFMVVGSSL